MNTLTTDATAQASRETPPVAAATAHSVAPLLVSGIEAGLRKARGLAHQPRHVAVALPTMHLRTPDPQCDLDYVPNASRDNVAARTMLSNSFAFGGSNAMLVLRAGA